MEVIILTYARISGSRHAEWTVRRIKDTDGRMTETIRKEARRRQTRVIVKRRSVISSDSEGAKEQLRVCREVLFRWIRRSGMEPL